MTYSFRNRIRLGDQKLQSDLKECALDESDGGEIVTLTALPGRTDGGFKTANWLLLDGRGYESSDQAFEAGKRWRQYLSVAFARARIAADFDTITGRHPDDPPESPEAPGLVVYPSPPSLLRFEGWASSVRIEPTLELFLSEHLPPVRESMPDGFESMPDVLKRRLTLAYSLVHLALSNANPDVQYILWITAIEALIPDEKPKRNGPGGKVVKYLQELREQVGADSERFNRRVRKRVARLLEQAQEETITITELGMTLARKLGKEYDGKPPDEFFRENYDGRSRLVHASQKRPDLREIQRRLPHLQQFVVDLLEIEAASVDEGRQTGGEV